MEQEPKSNPEELIEQTLDKLQAGEQPQESSPVTEQVEPQQVDEGDSAKTQSTVEPTEDKGFASHPKWLEREEKLKEARELLKQRDIEREQYSKLLDDPQVYAKWLKQQGYSDVQVAEAMRGKGYETNSRENVAEKPNQAQAIAERACNKLGWDINRLSAEQKAYINDSVSLTMAIIQEAVGPMIQQGVAPYEKMYNDFSQEKQFNSEDAQVRKLAGEEFKGVDFDDVIKPAIQKFCDEMDAKDPQRTIKLSYEDIYYRATRPLLRELEASKGRQEVRNTNKANARPLGTGPTSKSGEPAPKGGSHRDQLEAMLDAKGIR